MATAKGKPQSPLDPAKERLTSMAEDCVRLIIQGVGGIPGKPGGGTVRSIVRELRHMYAEIETPTPAPEEKRKKRETVDDYDDTEEDL